MIPVRASKKYRYWRLYSADGSHGSISELQFFMPGSDVPATGRPIGTHGLPPQRGLDKVFDGDWLTSYDHPDADGNWYGMAFDKPVVIDRVRCVPRTDDNLIHAGDTYELKYWDGIKWASLGCQVACEDTCCSTMFPQMRCSGSAISPVVTTNGYLRMKMTGRFGGNT